MGEVLMHNYFGWKISDDDLSFKAMGVAGTDITLQDKEEMKLIEPHLNNRRTAVEAGVHYGFSIPGLCSRFSHVHTFDFPNDVFDAFCVNMKDRNVKNLTIHPHGLGEESMDVKNIDRRHRKKFERGTLANSVVDKNTWLRPDDESYIGETTYQVKPLDELGLVDVDLIVLDTEGYELPVLKGATETIKRCSPVLVVEFHVKKRLAYQFGYMYKDLHKYLTQLGYVYEGQVSRVDRLYVRKA
jgi:FkbM family methyltransferase